MEGGFSTPEQHVQYRQALIRPYVPASNKLITLPHRRWLEAAAFAALVSSTADLRGYAT